VNIKVFYYSSASVAIERPFAAVESSFAVASTSDTVEDSVTSMLASAADSFAVATGVVVGPASQEQALLASLLPLLPHRIPPLPPSHR
jgi:hypothetical protein